MKSPTRKFWYFVAIGVMILILLILISSIMSIGERFGRIHRFVEYGFYVFAFLLIWILILNPIRVIVFSPTFSVETTLDKKSRRNYRTLKSVARAMLKNKDLSDAEKERIKINYKNYDDLRGALNHAFDHHIKKLINKNIMKNAKTVMLSTAISQNGRLDFITIIAVNIKMIKEIVLMCGFRPSFRNLSKLVINVFGTALIAEGLENLDLSDLLPTKAVSALGEIPLIKPLTSSAIQGISNALLTIRIGIVTRKYLFSDAGELTKETIRRGALLESMKLLPIVVADALAMIPKGIFSFFKNFGKKVYQDDFDYDTNGEKRER